MIAFTLSLVAALVVALAALLVPLADVLTRYLTGAGSRSVSRRETLAAAHPVQSAA